MRPSGNEQTLRAVVSWLNRAQAAQDGGRSDEAIAFYDRALGLKPDSLLALNGKGSLLGRLKQYDKALSCLDHAVRAYPDVPALRFNRALALQHLERSDEALEEYGEALRLKPDHAEAAMNRGMVLQTLKRFDEALADFDSCLARDPNNVLLLNSRAAVLAGLKRWDDALSCYDRALAIEPAHLAALTNRAILLLLMGREAESLQALDAIIALAPDHHPAHLHRSFILLRRGDLAAGWKEYEWRRLGSMGEDRPPFSGSFWGGKEDLQGKSILIFAEQGLGDTLQFCRYIDLLAARGAEITFRVPPELRELLSHLSRATVVGADRPPPQTAFYCPLLSLPLAFATELETVPASVPYLVPSPDRVVKWRQRLVEGEDKRLRVGIAWHGMHRKPFGEPDRSVPLHHFHALARIPGVRLISLQKGEGVEELCDVPRDIQIETLGDDFDSGPGAFLDSAAVMTQLDLVISVDTSLAHLAGALARPTWLTLKYVADWRWLIDRTDTPWYPTMRLCRQASPGDWEGVFASIADALRAATVIGARA
jgi:tetratricopeptide (TPR) repeat protein